MLWLYSLLGFTQIALLLGVRETNNDFCVCLKTVVDGLYNPLAIVTSHSKSHRTFIAEQNGLVSELYREPVNGQLTYVYLSLKDKIYISRENMDERGLLSMVLHPDFDENGRIFFFYLSLNKGQHLARVSEFKERDGHVNTDSEVILISVDYPDHRTNGGQILFGEDGYLYVSIGDGVINNRSQAQNGSSLLGKILRINVDAKEEGLNYSVPRDNPLWSMEETGWRKEIYAIGYRNPWRCSMDRGDSSGNGKGRIFCGETGDSDFDEINVIYKGGNYGWDIREGIQCTNRRTCEQREHEIPPLFTHKHVQHAPMTAIVGGIVYRGSLLPEMRGKYLYGDVFSGNLSRLKEDNGGIWESSPISLCSSSKCSTGASKKPYILSFGESIEGECYVLMTSSFSINVKAGAIYKMVPPDTVSRAQSYLFQWSTYHLVQRMSVIMTILTFGKVII